jgi:hypothetical protein
MRKRTFLMLMLIAMIFASGCTRKNDNKGVPSSTVPEVIYVNGSEVPVIIRDGPAMIRTSLKSVNKDPRAFNDAYVRIQGTIVSSGEGNYMLADDAGNSVTIRAIYGGLDNYAGYDVPILGYIRLDDSLPAGYLLEADTINGTGHSSESLPQ